MAQNRKFQDFVETKFLADDAVSNAKMNASATKHLTFLYDFDVDGGAIGSITLKDNNGVAQQIPAGAIVTNAYISVQTAVTSSGSATVAFGILGNTDAFKAATAKGTLVQDYVVAAANDLPITDAVPMDVQATIATAALTAGKIRIFVEYLERGYVA